MPEGRTTFLPRLGASAAFLLVVLLVAAAATTAAAIGFTVAEEPGPLLQELAHNQRMFLFANVLLMLAWFWMLPFSFALWGLFGERRPVTTALAVASYGISAILAFLAGAVNIVLGDLASMFPDASGATAASILVQGRVIHNLADAFLFTSIAASVPALTAFGVSTFRARGVMPPWTGVVALVAAVSSVVEFSAFFDRSLMWTAFVAGTAELLWFTAAGIVLLRQARQRA